MMEKRKLRALSLVGLYSKVEKKQWKKMIFHQKIFMSQIKRKMEKK